MLTSMPTAITIDVLPARFGDCLLIECHRIGTRPWRVVIDGGPTDCWPILRDRLLALPADDREIDLLVVTHIDADHIGGVLALFDVGEAEVPGLRIGEVWFNGFAHLPDPESGATRSPAQGQKLANLLGGDRVVSDDDRWAAQLPWNTAFGDMAVMTTDNGTFAERQVPDGPRLTVLSPTYKRLAILRAHWAAEIDKLRRGESDDELPEPEPPLKPLGDLAALAATPAPADGSKANGSSIVLLLEHRGASCLLAADGFANVLGAAAKGLAMARGASTLPVDAFKLPHHGSRANVTQTLVELAPATHYVISTNGQSFNHPDDEALARVVTGAAPGKTLWFNYRNDRTGRWEDPDLQLRYGFLTKYPEPGTDGVRLELPAKHEPPLAASSAPTAGG